MQIQHKISRQRSEALFNEAKTLFPGGVNSPVRAFKSVIGPPLFIRKGKGSRIWDEDGNGFTDFCCSWGPLILGHDNERIRESIIETVANGTSFGAPTALGNQLGKLILSNHRYIEKMRFVSSGTEAVMSAIRLARGVTGRDKILKFEGCYHGHVDSLLVRAGSGLVTFGVSTSAGIPDAFIGDTLVLPLDDTDALDRLLEQSGQEVACIIIEPVPANNGLLLQQRSFLQYLREQCTRYGILLIFDEVISGFRVGFEGAAGYYGIQPDIITFGKIIGGGMPVGAIGGRVDVMEKLAPLGDVYQAGTLSGNPVSVAAGLAALRKLKKLNPYAALETRTKKLVQRLEKPGLKIPTVGSIFSLFFTDTVPCSFEEVLKTDKDQYVKLFHNMLQRGVYLPPSPFEVSFLSVAHDDATLDIAATAFKESMP